MDYEVIVVGAGPAGATAAKCLAEKGTRVLLVDKNVFPREKPCGGGLPTRVLERFPYIKNDIDSTSYGSVTYSSSLSYKLQVLREKPMIHMVLRGAFDHALVKYAVEKGAVLLSKKTVVDIRSQKDNVQVVFEDGDVFETQMVIGCDGMRSVVAEKIGFFKKQENTCICLVQDQPLTKEELDTFFTTKRMVHLFIKVQGIAGYGWVFPKNTQVSIGVGEFSSAVEPGKSKKNLKEIYEAFVTVLKQQKILPESFPVENLKGGILPIFPLKKTYADHVLLCGDAAGFINPITGEGIYYAMVSGQIAADVTIQALKAGDTSASYLSQYQTVWMREFGRDLHALGRFTRQYGKNSEKIVRLMTIDRTFAKLIIGITGGQLSISKYKPVLLIRYIIASTKSIFRKKDEKISR